MTAIKIVFWFSLFLILYTWSGYPFLLYILSSLYKRILKRPPTTLNKPPFVSLLISAHNEERVIADKLANTLALDYPKDRLEIIVVSDCSTDSTDDIVGSHSALGVKLVRQNQHLGKSSALNQAVAVSRGDVIVFSDADSFYTQSAIKNLVNPFSNNRIGFVTGHTLYLKRGDNGITYSDGIYSYIERLTKRCESRFGLCVGADGAIFAIRKHLFSSLRPDDINDFVIPLKIILHGYHGVLAETSVCLEFEPDNASSAFRRQIRISARTLTAIFRHFRFSLVLKFPIFSFFLISHKFLKYLSPFVLLSVFFTNLILCTQSSFFLLLIISQILLYTMGLCFYFKPSRFSIFNHAAEFLKVNLAYLKGWISLFRKNSFQTWTPRAS